LLDGIDLTIEVPAATASDLILPPPTEGSREVAARWLILTTPRMSAAHLAEALSYRAFADEIRRVA